MCPGWEQRKLETPRWGKGTWPEKEQCDFIKLVNEVAEVVKEPVLHLKIDALVGRCIRQQMPGWCRGLECEQGGGSEPRKVGTRQFGFYYNIMGWDISSGITGRRENEAGGKDHSQPGFAVLNTNSL